MTPEETARLAAARAWGRTREQLFAQDLGDYFPWAKRHAIVLVKDASFRSMLVAVTPTGDCLVFRELPGLDENQRSLNTLLRREGIGLPSGMPEPELAKMLRYFLAGPGGFVASRAFLKEQGRNMGLWTSRSAGEDVFARYCRDPQLEQRANEWTLQFFFFNNRGGVEEWRVRGGSQAITRVTREFPVPDASFNFPYG
jgi:hypothetical protein